MRPYSLLALALLLSCGPSTRPAPPAGPTPPGDPVADTPVAPTPPAEPALPLWPAITHGTLPNGLTYYVLPHQQPKQRAALWLAVNAGALQEDDDQQGLAHFVEHMAFNGTESFPKLAIVNYLESIGMAFGPHVNAYTSFDETVYQLQVPTDDPKYVNKGLEVLREWAGKISFDAAEVDKERGVVLEEWRLGRGAGRRVFDKQSEVLFGGTRYAKRIPIGKPDILKKAPRDTLVRFYKDWYRPDLMAVIVVGDVDPATIVAQVTATFGDLKNPATLRPRVTADGLAGRGTQVSIETDKEMSQSRVEVQNLFPRRAEATESDFRNFVIEGLYHAMLGERMAQLSRQPEAPFMFAFSSTGTLVRQFDSYRRTAIAKDGEIEKALEVVLQESARVERHGFTAGELARAKKGAQRRAQQSAAEFDKEHARSYADEMTRNFFEGEQMIGRVAELALWEKFLPGVELDEINQLAKQWGGDENRAVLLSGPDGTAMPSKERVLELVAAVEKSTLEPWVDTPAAATLMAKAPAPGTIVDENTYDKIGVTVWTLGNGARVVLKPTDFENQTIHVSAVSPGGTALVKDKDFTSARMAAGAVAVGGVGDHSVTDLVKLLAGVTARGNFWISENQEGLSGSGSVEDLEVLAQLLHLGFTAPRKDTMAFMAWKLGQKNFLKNRDLVPETEFFDAMTAVMTGGHKRRKPTVAADLDEVDLDRAHGVYRERFGDVSDFTFVIVGSFEVAKVRPLVETYIASLPGKGRKDPWKDIGVKRPKGVVEKVVKRGSEPKATVSITFFGDEKKWTKEMDRDGDILADVLRIRLREILREDMGGVYGVSVTGDVTRQPKVFRSFAVRFGCAPENVAPLRKAVFDEIARIQQEGVTQEYLDKVKETRRRTFETNQRNNNWWEGRLSYVFLHGDDPEGIIAIDEVLARATSDNVKAAARRFLDKKRYVVGVLEPAGVQP
jgi:zinc protease